VERFRTAADEPAGAVRYLLNPQVMPLFRDSLDSFRERAAILAAIDSPRTRYRRRLGTSRSAPSREPEDTEALFELPDMYRVVPVRDQLAIEWAA
jgi:hypothetical protein